MTKISWILLTDWLINCSYPGSLAGIWLYTSYKKAFSKANLRRLLFLLRYTDSFNFLKLKKLKLFELTSGIKIMDIKIAAWFLPVKLVLESRALTRGNQPIRQNSNLLIHRIAQWSLNKQHRDFKHTDCRYLPVRIYCGRKKNIVIGDYFYQGMEVLNHWPVRCSWDWGIYFHVIQPAINFYKVINKTNTDQDLLKYDSPKSS